jgi:hypothetical protein
VHLVAFIIRTDPTLTTWIRSLICRLILQRKHTVPVKNLSLVHCNNHFPLHAICQVISLQNAYSHIYVELQPDRRQQKIPVLSCTYKTHPCTSAQLIFNWNTSRRGHKHLTSHSATTSKVTAVLTTTKEYIAHSKTNTFLIVYVQFTKINKYMCINNKI